MGNYPGLLRDSNTLVGLGPNQLFNESFVRDKYQSSPLRLMTQSQSEREDNNLFSKQDVEQFAYILGQAIGIDKYSHSMLNKTSNLAPLQHLESMRSELLLRTNYQTRQQLEENVCFHLVLSSKTLYGRFTILCITFRSKSHLNSPFQKHPPEVAFKVQYKFH